MLLLVVLFACAEGRVSVFGMYILGVNRIVEVGLGDSGNGNGNRCGCGCGREEYGDVACRRMCRSAYYATTEEEESIRRGNYGVTVCSTQ